MEAEALLEPYQHKYPKVRHTQTESEKSAILYVEQQLNYNKSLNNMCLNISIFSSRDP